MRRNLVLAVALGAAIAVGFATVAAATTIHLRAGNLVLTFSSSASPKKLPRDEFVPVTVKIGGKIETSDGTHPSAFREMILDLDKNGSLDVKGFPVCKASQLEARDTKGARKACGDTILGSGTANAEVAFPEQGPIKVFSPLLIFNGGERGGKVTLLIHTFITVPAPAALVTTVTIQRVHKGRYGFHIIAKIPVIAGGSGSALDFSFKMGKTFTYKGKKQSVISGKCPDGHFNIKILKSLFKNEAHIPGVPATTGLQGSLIVPCTPKG